MTNVIRWISRNPVAALTTVYTVLAAVVAVVVKLDLLSDSITAILTAIVAALAAVLGVLTHRNVTPLVDPKTNDGVPLKPWLPPL